MFVLPSFQVFAPGFLWLSRVFQGFMTSGVFQSMVVFLDFQGFMVVF